MTVQDIFAEQIRRQSVTMAEVLKLEHNHPLLKNCENKRLHDKVRRLYPFKKTTDGECLEDTQKSVDAIEDSDVNSLTVAPTNQSKTRIFEEEEFSLFKELFKDMIQNGVKIEQKEVVNRLKRNRHGYLYEKYTKQKVTDKIRGLLTTHIREWRNGETADMLKKTTGNSFALKLSSRKIHQESRSVHTNVV
ncbi:hypothetical protein pdam_00022935 [Pocillopora damicornis]|uniref:Uncharacterized protein n=1 Tax=Pocillopora damicornis TaxID=46731 RepID=A0A3M6UG95_POCDA|nr:hypothetical protein pdam_00022935 [Pocillopora damicornis]